MEQLVRARTPAHVWIVGALATLWTAFGAFDYLMTQTNNEAYLSQFSTEERAYFAAFPAWLDAFWAVGVWVAVAGSLLILARNRYAVHAFAVSLVGMVISFAYQITSDAPASLDSGMAAVLSWIMMTIIMAVGVLLLLYAWNMNKKGVLR